ncbi:MAG: site-specific DNA-methyltransferase [Gammaproteobacteria bacterium]|nr:site-specific DNA-methyltransferase [Gammaproteobacteria bacterium]
MKNLPKKFRNKVIKGDALDALRALPSDCVDMIWGDPDYGVGINYNGKRYTKKWAEYIDWYIGLARESLRVLKPTGNLFMMNYPKQNAHLRAHYLDDAAHDVFEYVWVYPTNVGHSPRRFTTAHRSILHATKSKNNHFYKDQVAQPYRNPTDKRIKGRIADGSSGRMPYSWLQYNLVKNVSREKTFHACQIPQDLSELFIKSCTRAGDSVFVLFGGSGSEVAKVKSLKRIYLTCEMHPDYCEVIRARLKNNAISREHRLSAGAGIRDTYTQELFR